MRDQRKRAEGKVEPGYVCSPLSREAPVCYTERKRLHFHPHKEKPEVMVPFRRDKGSPRESVYATNWAGEDVRSQTQSEQSCASFKYK